MRNVVYAMAMANVALAAAVLAAAPAEPAQPRADAADLYARAAKQIRAHSPASTNLEYRDFPPFPKEWIRAAEDAWNANAPVRDLARQARSCDRASWPDIAKDAGYLNSLRGLANDLADACLYEDVRHHSAAAIELARDELHLAALLQQKPGQVVRLLVGAGIYASAANRLLVVTSGVALTRADRDTPDLNVRVARDLIAELLDQRDATEHLADILGPEGSPARKAAALTVDTERLTETINRCNAERTFAALSMACHLYRFDNGRWPGSLEELVPAYLARVPLDPWGDGKQTFGYAVIRGGLPDGSDRPLVYARCRSEDGLLYRVDEPQYGFYVSDGSPLPANRQQQGGQFRDVARWQPRPLAPGAATIKALP